MRFCIHSYFEGKCLLGLFCEACGCMFAFFLLVLKFSVYINCTSSVWPVAQTFHVLWLGYSFMGLSCVNSTYPNLCAVLIACWCTVVTYLSSFYITANYDYELVIESVCNYTGFRDRTVCAVGHWRSRTIKVNVTAGCHTWSSAKWRWWCRCFSVHRQ